ncbi:MAG: hypothetical protein AB1513_12025 [Pseudomonadota bacterium]
MKTNREPLLDRLTELAGETVSQTIEREFAGTVCYRAKNKTALISRIQQLAGADVASAINTEFDKAIVSFIPPRSAPMKTRYFKRKVALIQTFLACGRCGAEQPAEHDGLLIKHCIACGDAVPHNELCPHCHAIGADDALAMFSTFKACPICGGMLNQPVAELV